MKVVEVLIVRENLLVQPRNEGLTILDSRFPEPEELPDLGPVILDGAPIPVIVSPLQGHDVDLTGDVLNDNTGDILPLLGKTPLVLEELQQDGKPQARRPALVGEQPLLAGQHGPVLE